MPSATRSASTNTNTNTNKELPRVSKPLSSYFTAANAKKAYLITYNAVSAAAWAYVLLYTTLHLVGLLHITPPVQITAKAAAATTFQRVIAKLPFTSSLFSSPLDNAKAKIYSSVPPALVPLLNRAKTLYPVIGPQLAFIQSFAVLELVHVLTGLVRSPLITTGMQVSSRLILIWEVAERFEEARTSPIFSSMVLAWSVTEVIRYSYYASTLSGYEPYALLWLRYTTFYVLYPIGAGSEAFVTLATVPINTGAKYFGANKWSLDDFARATVFVTWWPCLYIMYTHMMKQRAKVLETGKRLGGNGDTKKKL